MNKKLWLCMPLIALTLVLVWIAGLSLNTGSVQAQTAYSTPTPGPDGKIVYIVQPGDSCLRIELLTKVTVADIKKLNALNEGCDIYEGQELVIGEVQMPTATLQLQPTATLNPALVTPSPTPGRGFAKICVVLFNDMDGNGRRTAFETHLFGGVASVTDRTGSVSVTGKTKVGDPDAGTADPLCFDQIPEGAYNVSVAIPDGFNATTVTNYPLEVKAGESATIDFGAQQSVGAVTENTVGPTNTRSPLLGIIGAVILLSGLGLGFYMWRQRKL